MMHGRNRAAAFVAMLAISLQALWPLLAQTKPESAKLLVPVCSIEGITHYLELPGSNAPLGQRSAVQHEHCALCVFSAERLATVPPAPSPALRVDQAAHAAVTPGAAVVVASRCSLPAQPRAPPALS